MIWFGVSPVRSGPVRSGLPAAAAASFVFLRPLERTRASVRGLGVTGEVGFLCLYVRDSSSGVKAVFELLLMMQGGELPSEIIEVKETITVVPRGEGMHLAGG
ncbi:unnamed protein product [Pylaiella littoralis]